MNPHNKNMAFLDIVIDVLKINCGVAQCSGYASEIEALFYLLFFPTVFIILFVYVVVGSVMDKVGGKEGGLRILISVALYAFIIFEEYYTLFVSLSKLWWVLLATLVGLWVFIRQFIHGKGGSEGGAYSGFGGRSLVDFGSRKLRGKLEGTEKKKVTQINQEISNLRTTVNTIEKEFKNPSRGTDIGNLIDKYNAHKKYILEIIEGYSELGKVNEGGIMWDIEKKDEKFMHELKELDNKIEEISKKIYRNAK